MPARLGVDNGKATQLAILRERQHHGDEVGDRDVTHVEPLSELRRKEFRRTQSSHSS